MTDWWHHARVASAVGAGALILATTSTTAAVAADSERVEFGLVVDRLDDPGLGQWIRTGDVLRFRVRLAGATQGARLALAANPSEALSAVSCEPSSPSAAASPSPSPSVSPLVSSLVTPVPSVGVPPSPGVEPLPSWSATPMAGGAARVASGAQVCSLGEIKGERAVDVRLTVPTGVDEVVLAAVAQMSGPAGKGMQMISKTTRTPVGERVGPAVPEREQASAGTTAVKPQEPAAAQVERQESATAQQVPAAAREEQRESAAAQVETESAAAQVETESAAAQQGPATVQEKPRKPAAAQVEPQEPVTAQPEQPEADETAGGPAVEDFSAPEPGGAGEQPDSMPDSMPEFGGPVEEGPSGMDPALPEEAGPGFAADPELPPDSTGEVAEPDSAGAAADPAVPGGSSPEGPTPGASPGQAEGLAESGEVQGLWNDPNLRLPQAAPQQAAEARAAEALSAPLPRQIPMANKKFEVNEPLNLLTGLRGLPVAAAGIGLLMGSLWAVVAIQRGRIQRRTQSVP